MENKQSLILTDFVYLMLAKFAENSQIMNSKGQKVVAIPSNYKQIIENILCSENGWRNKFSVLIDIEEYFEDHFFWERRLAIELKKVLEELNKNYKYDLVTDSIFLEFSQDEIDRISINYPDEFINEAMNHFTNLISDYIYTREYQERFFDYSAKSVEKMHNLKHEHQESKQTSKENIKTKVLKP